MTAHDAKVNIIIPKQEPLERLHSSSCYLANLQLTVPPFVYLAALAGLLKCRSMLAR